LDFTTVPLLRPKPEPRAPNEVATTLAAIRGSFAATAAFSFFGSLLLLTVPLYLLQIYDRVLTSRSHSTLVGLTAIAVAMLGVMAALELVRSRVLVRIGAVLDARLGPRVFSAAFDQTLAGSGAARTQWLRDLDAVRHFLTGSGPFALFDAPWVPVYLAVIALFHPLLGAVAALGALVLFALALLNEAATRTAIQQANVEAAGAVGFAETSFRNAEVLEALGMLGAIRARWLGRHRRGLALQALASDRAGSYAAASKAARLLLQIAILGVGAALAIDQSITAGTIVAASILAGRALAPVELAIANWRGFVAARFAYQRVSALLLGTPPRESRMELPAPVGRLTVEDLVALPPGASKPVLHGISFALEPGEALGVIGPTAAGKSTLARHLVGVSRPAAGSVRLDGASLQDWRREDLGPRIGYLPQDVELFEGSVQENIARFEANPDPARVVEAARGAGVHEMILGLPKGYDTPIGVGGGTLSAGQRQRIALARALYGDPALVVLDEPNSNLDVDGDRALTAAIFGLKERGAAVVVVAHRPSAIAAVDKILVLREGRVAAFGPRQEVLSGPVRMGSAFPLPAAVAGGVERARA
jgi:PrtD family type I secretion system ABC transporter